MVESLFADDYRPLKMPEKQNEISLGKVNFCMKALVGKGCLKVNNFRNSNNKRAYTYLLTPFGMEEKSRMTLTFLRYKVQEYEQLRREIEALKIEARKQKEVKCI